MSQNVRIINPPAGSSPFTSQKRAEKYVRDGRAYWCKKSLRFYEAHQRGRSPLTMDTVDAMRGVPVLKPMEMMIRQTKPRVGRTQAYRSGPVRRVTV